MNLKQKLAKKLKKSGGFTLIEMLIVVAIIAILVAVSIPMVNSGLEKARRATDDANLRAAKAVAMISGVEGTLNGEEGGTALVPNSKTYYYNVATGELQEGVPTDTNPTSNGQASGYTDKYLTVTFDTDFAPTVKWAPAS